MGHPDFRLGGKIIATLGAPDADWGMVLLLPEQQEIAIEEEPEAFKPAAGGWGRTGSTLVRLGTVSDNWLDLTIEWAWSNRFAAMKP